jgi:O-antigen ligase
VSKNLLDGLLFATVVAPALVFLYGTWDGQVAFVLYREPKLAAMQILGWSLLAALAWSRPGGLGAAAVLARMRRPAWGLLAFFVAWSLVTVLWVEVPENLFLELGQYALLLALVLTLDAWAERDPAVPRIVESGIVLSLGAATVVGLFQTAVPIAILAPIDPQASLGGPSVLGYKNPMALAVVGQIFLLVPLLARASPGYRRRLLAGLLAAELIYVATLNSRTSWMALFGGAAVIGLLLSLREGLRRRGLRGAGAVAVAVVLFAAVQAADPVGRQRAASVLGYLAHPASFLESDRGTYLLNTLEMVRHHPLGVGLGDWQTAYPLYRRYRPDLFFSGTVQVRHAHSDPVQYLGETGWPGLILWLGLAGSLLAAPAARYLRAGDPQSLFAAGQVAALALAMLTDSVVQHPYGKLQLFLTGFLALQAGGGQPATGAAQAPEPRGRRVGSTALASALTLAAAVMVLLSMATVAKAFLAARTVALYREVDAGLSRRTGPPELAGERTLLRRAVQAGETFARIPGYTHELCDDYLVLSQAELLLGRRDKALTYLRRSLRLHPHNPAAQRFMEDLQSPWI